MLDLQVTEYQMKIQRVKDNIARHAQDTHKLVSYYSAILGRVTQLTRVVHHYL